MSSPLEGAVCSQNPDVTPSQLNHTEFIDNAKILQLASLPTEILLMIASYLPLSNHTLLGLTCKRFRRALRYFTHIMHKEQPLNFQQAEMSEPKKYHPLRWEFLRLLEKDLFGQWLICHDCFILHPAHMFAKPEVSPVEWLSGLLRSQSQPRSCRQLLRLTGEQEFHLFTLWLD